jgi:transposase
MRAYSADLRSRVLAAVLAGHPPATVADRFGVSPSWVRRVRQRHRDGGETGPRRRGHRPQALAADADRIRQAIAADPDLTLAELKARLGLAAHLATLWRAVARLGLTLKKSRPGRPSRTART